MTELVLAVLSLGTGVFAASAAAKLRSRAAYRDYRAGLRASTLLRERLLPGSAAALVAAEAAVTLTLAAAAVLILTRVTGAILLAEFALGLACALMATLAIGVAVVVRRGVPASCACFGTRAGRQLTRVHVVRNLCLLIVLLAGLAAAAVPGGKPAPAGSLIALATGLVAAMGFVRWDDLAYLFGAGVPGPDRTGT